jgi:tetrahydromethanopterin S-methyltransferase subunit H
MMSWGRDYGTLVDNFGNAYKRIGMSTYQLYGSIEDSESIYPRKAIKDILIYELPINGTKYLHLDLPADNVGIAGKSFKIEIPSNGIM